MDQLNNQGKTVRATFGRPLKSQITLKIRMLSTFLPVEQSMNSYFKMPKKSLKLLRARENSQIKIQQVISIQRVKMSIPANNFLSLNLISRPLIADRKLIWILIRKTKCFALRAPPVTLKEETLNATCLHRIVTRSRANVNLRKTLTKLHLGYNQKMTMKL